jgi:hypothetical protein
MSIAGKASGDSMQGVPELIFREIQDSFTFDSGFDSLPAAGVAARAPREPESQKAGIKPAFRRIAMER